jgi:predicted CXXCH cytochrome family protein
VTILGLALGAVTAVSALANAGPHGGYGINTTACAGCHRAHTATGPMLLLAGDVEALCETCHLDGAGAPQDPWNGTYVGVSGSRLNGGGFRYINGAPVTSAHDVGAVATAWGGASSGPGPQGLLECTSCHNPHGSTNYRILRDSQNGSPTGANAWQHRWDYTGSGTIDDTEALDWQDYQVKKTQVLFLDGGSNEFITYYMTNYTQGMNNFCATCHKSYLTRSGSASVPSTSSETNGDGQQIYVHPGTQDALDGQSDIARYRHAVTMTYTGTMQSRLRLSSPGDAWQFEPGGVMDPNALQRTGMVCTTCHFAHGTTATVNSFAGDVGPAGDSALLYLPNRGVCYSCHQVGQ